MVGTPKASVANDFRPRVKTSVWPFCKHIPALTTAIMATFDFQSFCCCFWSWKKNHSNIAHATKSYHENGQKSRSFAGVYWMQKNQQV